MYSVRKWMFRPKGASSFLDSWFQERFNDRLKTDTSLLAQFYFADEELNAVAAELDKFDGRKDPERCTRWVNRLRACQDRVLSVIETIMDDALSDYYRSSRDFRVKFPDDVLQESLSGQLWFGAECLAAGSSILNREAESASMRPLAKAMTRQLDYVRNTLREQCLRNLNFYTDEIRDALVVFDRLFAEFELSYVSAMVPVKTMKEYDTLQEVIVLFSDTVQRALELKLLTQEMLEDCDPALMFAIPRLAIICGLLVYPEGPLNPDMDPLDMSEMFRPFQTLLYNIRELMRTLDKRELRKLETLLCKNNSPSTPDVVTGQFEFMDVTPGGSSGPGASTSTVEPLSTPAGPAGHQLCDQLQYCAYLHVNSSDSDSADGMSRSVSIDTVIVNAATNDNFLAHPGESCDRTCDRGSTSSSMHHQDSVDSGLLSGSDGAAPVASLSWQPSNVVKARYLRHSLSWPEISKHRSHRHMHELNTRRRTLIVDGLNLGSGSTFDASMFSPLGGSTGVMETTNYHVTNVDEAAIPRDVSPSDRIACVTADNIDSDDGLQVSYVTPTLSDVFLTDTTFQSAQGSPASNDAGCRDNTRVDVAMETTSGALATATGVICDTTNNDDNNDDNSIATNSNTDHEHTRSMLQIPTRGRDVNDSACAVNSSSPSSASTLRDSRKTPKSRRTDDHVTSQDSGRCTEEQKCDPRMWEQDSVASSDTSSYTSACHDDEEIAMAIQAAELAARQEARSRFKNTSDLLHRLFVCISGVADQLQTNYAGDLRNVLKAVFEINCPPPQIDDDNDSNQGGCDSPTAGSGDNSSGEMNTEETGSESGTDGRTFGVAPPWVPDEQTSHCTGCQVAFSFVRRKHHCRNCGKIFCGRCSSNSAPLPHFGFEKAVRVCNHCFMFELTPFTTDTYE